MQKFCSLPLREVASADCAEVGRSLGLIKTYSLSQLRCATPTEEPIIVSANYLSAFPLRGRLAADCAARMRWCGFMVFSNEIRLDTFHLISRYATASPQGEALVDFCGLHGTL